MTQRHRVGVPVMYGHMRDKPVLVCSRSVPLNGRESNKKLFHIQGKWHSLDVRLPIDSFMRDIPASEFSGPPCVYHFATVKCSGVYCVRVLRTDRNGCITGGNVINISGPQAGAFRIAERTDCHKGQAASVLRVHRQILRVRPWKTAVQGRVQWSVTTALCSLKTTHLLKY
jgi:hypothetical protein